MSRSGSTFLVDLPLSILQLEEESSQRVSPTAESQPGELVPLPKLEGIRAFIVNDERDSREILERVLRDQGARVTRLRRAADRAHSRLGSHRLRAGGGPRALVAGYQAHLAKPFDVAELILVVADLVGR